MILPDLNFEKNYWQKGFKYIAGIDEVGRGSWAGPLVAAGVILPSDFEVPQGFADSKQLTSKKRDIFCKLIESQAVSFTIAEISNNKINIFGIAKATQIVFRKIVRNLNPAPNYLLIDAFHIKYFPKKKQLAIKYGDKKSATIAAASIIAKVYRDNLMTKFAQKFPKYSFEKNKGYGTKFHQQSIKSYGFTKIHRTSFNLDYLLT